MEDLKKYREAKMFFCYDKAVKESKDENGIINQEKLNKILLENYQRMRKYLEEKNIDAKCQISQLEEVFELAKDRKQMEYYEAIERQEKHIKAIGIDESSLSKSSSMILKTVFSRKKDPTFITVQVSPKGETSKKVRITNIGEIQYKTAFNLYSNLSIYVIEKNIQGINRRFVVGTNTNFRTAYNLINQGRENISIEDEQYLEYVEQQLSDINLLASQRQLNGYIGTVEKKDNNAEIYYDPEEYCAYKKELSRNQNNDVER